MLVKLYHFEIGTQAVDQIANAADTTIRISRLTPTELVSAFAIKVRTKAIDRDDALQFLQRFRTDIVAGKFELFSVAESEFAVAEELIGRYAFDQQLRTLDALQLAVALELRRQDLIDIFVAADRVLCEIASLEDLAVINPAQA